MKVQELLVTKRPGVITITPQATVLEACQLLSENHVGAVVVVDQRDKPIGILSERDVVREVALQAAVVLQKSVESIMTRNLIIATPDDEIEYVTYTMTEKNIRHLPIMEDGQLIGIVSIRDVVKAQVAHYKGEIQTLEQHLMATNVG